MYKAADPGEVFRFLDGFLRFRDHGGFAAAVEHAVAGRTVTYAAPQKLVFTRIGCVRGCSDGKDDRTREEHTASVGDLESGHRAGFFRAEIEGHDDESAAVNKGGTHPDCVSGVLFEKRFAAYAGKTRDVVQLGRFVKVAVSIIARQHDGASAAV